VEEKNRKREGCLRERGEKNTRVFIYQIIKFGKVYKKGGERKKRGGHDRRFVRGLRQSDSDLLKNGFLKESLATSEKEERDTLKRKKGGLAEPGDSITTLKREDRRTWYHLNFTNRPE